MASSAGFSKVTEMVGSKASVWTVGPLANGEYSAVLSAAHLSDKTGQIHGTFGTGGSMTVYGSNVLSDVEVDPSSGGGSWVALKDNQDNDLTKTVLGGDFIVENYYYICVKVTAGDGGTALNFSVCAKGDA